MSIAARIVPPEEAQDGLRLMRKANQQNARADDLISARGWLESRAPDLIYTAVVLGEQREAVLALHFEDAEPGAKFKGCHGCIYQYPCPTARALGVTA